MLNPHFATQMLRNAALQPPSLLRSSFGYPGHRRSQAIRPRNSTGDQNHPPDATWSFIVSSWVRKASPILRECHVRSGSCYLSIFLGFLNPEKIPVLFGVQSLMSIAGVGCGSKVIQSAPLRNQCRKDATCETWRWSHGDGFRSFFFSGTKRRWFQSWFHHEVQHHVSRIFQIQLITTEKIREISAWT